VRATLLRLRLAYPMLLLVMSGCAHAPPPAAANIVPIVDYHQHLLSVATADRVSPPPLPAIALPEDLARLLRERAERWSDATMLAQLYSKDSIALGTESPGWIRGPAAIAAYLTARFARAYEMTPVEYRPAGSAGRIAGYYTRGEGAQTQRFGYFHLVVERGDDGAWRIAAETSAFPGPVRLLDPMDAAQVVSRLDAAGTQRAVVLSDAFLYGSRSMPISAEESAEARHSLVRAENDWVAGEVAKYPQRLIAFCSFNPLESYALVELERCTRDGRMRGLKLHFTESRVDLQNAQHVEAVRRIFEAANARRLPIVVHVGADPTHAAVNAQMFLERILAAAPDVTVQLAHLWGGELFSDEALGVYAKAVAAKDPRTKNLYFDVAEATLMAERAGDAADEVRKTIAARIRQIGADRILFGSDDHIAPREAWAAFRTQIPLTDAERDTIARNIVPYLR
jgi:predicted TIM-barrel fold metal-dependent hydrolase